MSAQAPPAAAGPTLLQALRTVGSVVVLSAAYVLTALTGILSAASLVVGHPERLETMLFATVLLLTPVGILAAKRNLTGLDDEAGSRLAMLNAAAIAALLASARITDELSGHVALALGVLLGGALLITVANVEAFRRHRALESLTVRGSDWRIPAVTVALMVAAVCAFLPTAYFRPMTILLTLGSTLAMLAAWRFSPPVRASLRWRAVVDGLVLATMALVVADINVYGDANRFDYDFFLGPVNAMRHGHPMLVDTFSQYGVGLFYALVGAFELVPLSYGGLQAILCLGYIAEFGLVYAVLRAACRSQIVAVTGLTVALVANVAAPSSTPYIAYPSTGPFRFGLPWVVVLAGIMIARSPNPRPGWRALMLTAVAIASIWSIETFWFCFSAYVGMAATRLAFESDSPDRRLRELLIDIFRAIAVSVVAVAFVSILTRAFAERWPSWSTYLDLVETYGLDEFGALPVAPWSPGYLLLAVYILSAIGVIALATQPGTGLSYAPQLAAIGGATAYGVTSFTYFLGRSTPSNLHHIAIPAIVVACAWFAVVRPWLDRAPRWVALSAVATLAWLGASTVAHSATTVVSLLESSPLGEGLRSPMQPLDQARSLLGSDPRRPQVEEAKRLLRSHVVTGRPVVLVRPDLLTSALLSGGYGNALPIVNGNQDRLIAERSLKSVSRAVDNLPSGTVLLTEDRFLARAPQSFLTAMADSTRYREHGEFYVAQVLAAVRGRFEMRVTERGKFGLVVVELGRRQ